MLAVVLLSLLVFVAAAAVSDHESGRSEQVIEIGLWSVAFVTFPIYLLGLASMLTRASVALAAIVVSLLAVLFAVWFLARRPRDLGRQLVEIFTIPFDVFAGAARARSLVVVLVPIFYALMFWMALQIYLAPNWKDWDSLWYHEAMTGFAIQNHGFAPVDLPFGLQRINGFQRLGEMIQLWFGIFAGRRLIDAANFVTEPILLASMFAFARRFGADVGASAGWAIALAVLPGNLRLMQSTMVDCEAASLLLAASYWVSRPNLTPRAVVVAGLALTLAVGAKINAIFPCFLLTLVLLVRIVAWRRNFGWGGVFALASFVGLSEVAMIAFTHLRNWLLFGNPLWPVVAYDNPERGIHWVGEAPPGAVDVNITWSDLVERLTSRPYSASLLGGPTWQSHDYGFAYAWLALPLATVCLVIGFAYLPVSLVTTRKSAVRSLALGAVTVSTIGLLAFALSPASFAARYNIAPVGMMMVSIMWLAGKRGFSRIADAVTVFTAWGSLIMAFWASPRWLHDFRTMALMVRTPYPVRECRPDFGAPVTLEVCLARERELAPGSILAFGDTVYPSVLFNNDYSNRVVWLRDPLDPLGEAERMGALWVHAPWGSPLHTQARTSDKWKLVGKLEVEHKGDVFRRSGI